MAEAQSKSRQGDKTAAQAKRASAPGAPAPAQAQLMPAYAQAQGSSPVMPLLGGTLQAKLTVGQPDDPFEREADAAADRVSSGATVSPKSLSNVNPGTLARQASHEKTGQPDEEEAGSVEAQLQPRADEEQERRERERREREERAERAIREREEGGRPLEPAVRAPLETGFGADFGGVRVHTGPAAQDATQAIGARAFTHGSHIWLGAGERPDGLKLLAHEAAHVVQQGGAPRRQPEAAEAPLDRERRGQDEERKAQPQAQKAPADAEREPPAPADAPHATRPAANVSSPVGTKPAQTLSTDAAPAQGPATRGSGSDLNAGPTTGTAGATTDTATPKTETATPTPGAPAATTPAGATEAPTAATATNAPDAPAPGSTPAPPVKTPSAGADAGKQAVGAPLTSGAGPGGAALVEGAGGGLAGGGRGEAAEPVEPQVDTSSAEGVLTSLSTVPASGFARALDMAAEAAPSIQEQEKAQLAADFPEVEKPTGLPRKPAPLVAPTDLGGKDATEPGIEGERQGEPLDTKHEAGFGPLPASEPMPHVVEPAAQEEDEGSWWDWLVNKVSNFLGTLPTTDAGVNTSAGERPKVDTTGDADPAQNERSRLEGREQVAAGRADADAATYEYFGEDDIYPTVPAETLRPGYTPAPPAGGLAGNGSRPPALDPKAQAALDANAAPHLKEKVDEQREEYERGRQDYEQQSAETRREGQRQIAEEDARVRGQQQGMQGEAQGLIGEERERWRAENAKLIENYETQSEAKRAETDKQIGEKVKTAEDEADQKMTGAEKEAAEEKRKAEEKAAEEKRKEEAKPRSWWDKVKGAVSSVLNAIKKAVSAIFDALRWAVKKIFEAVKWVVRGIIEAVRAVVVGLIYVFSEFVKGLVSVALVAFPEKAKAAREWIDGKRDAAIGAVNDAAEWLKEKTDAILDWVAGALDSLLGLLQTLWNVGMELLRLLATGELAELWQKLKNLGNAAWDGFGLIEGEIWKELIGFDLTKDLGAQMAAGDAKEQAAQMAEEGQGDAENIAFLLQDQVSADQVVVEPVPVLELDDELMAQLLASEEGGGENISSETEDGEGVGTDAIKADLLASLPQEQLPTDADQSEAAAAQLDPTTRALMERMATAHTRAERFMIIKDLIVAGLEKFWEEKLKPNLWWLIPAVLVGLAAFIVLEVFTGGAITAAVPVILELIAGALVINDILKVAAGLGEYLEKAWAGDVAGGAQAFAHAVAVGVVSIIMLLLFEVGGAAVKAAFKGVARGMRAGAKAVAAGAKAVATGAKAAAKGIVKGVLYLGKLAVKAAKIGASLVARSGKFLLKKGKLFFKGVSNTIGRGVKKVGDFFKRMKEFFGKFKGFSIERGSGSFFILYAIFNPKVPVGIIPEKKKVGVTKARYKELRKGTPSGSVRKGVNEVPAGGPKIKRDPITGEKVDVLEADHIHPMKKVVQEDGFNELPFEDQLEVLNNPENFMGLSKPMNASKGAKSYSEWMGHSKKGPIPKDIREQLEQRERDAIDAVRKDIQERLAKAAAKKGLKK